MAFQAIGAREMRRVRVEHGRRTRNGGVREQVSARLLEACIDADLRTRIVTECRDPTTIERFRFGAKAPPVFGRYVDNPHWPEPRACADLHGYADSIERFEQRRAPIV